MQYHDTLQIYLHSKKDLAETYCVWHLHGVNVPLEVIVVGLHADDVIYDLIHLQKKSQTNKRKRRRRGLVASHTTSLHTELHHKDQQ